MRLGFIAAPLFTLTILMSILVSFLVPSPALASVVFAPSVTYETRSVQDTVNGGGIPSRSDTKELLIDGRLGYLFDANGLYVGALYKMESDSYVNGSLTGFAMGPSVGYAQSGFSAIFTYFFAAERSYTISNVQTKLTAGKGYQLDLAYAFPFGTNLGIGPLLSYRTTKYDYAQVGANPQQSTSWELTSLSPSFLFWFTF